MQKGATQSRPHHLSQREPFSEFSLMSLLELSSIDDISIDVAGEWSDIWRNFFPKDLLGGGFAGEVVARAAPCPIEQEILCERGATTRDIIVPAQIGEAF